MPFMRLRLHFLERLAKKIPGLSPFHCPTRSRLTDHKQRTCCVAENDCKSSGETDDTVPVDKLHKLGNPD